MFCKFYESNCIFIVYYMFKIYVRLKAEWPALGLLLTPHAICSHFSNPLATDNDLKTTIKTIKLTMNIYKNIIS